MEVGRPMRTAILCCCVAVLCSTFWAGGGRVARATPIDSLFQECARPGVPGASVAVVRDGKVIFEKSYGLADVEHHVAATTETNYRLASLTKQFTAMGIMILADRGTLAFDQRLSELFPALPP